MTQSTTQPITQSAQSEFFLSEATADAVELSSLLALVAHLAATDVGRDRLLARRPFAEEEALREHRDRYSEAERLVSAGPLVSLLDRPLAPLLEALFAGGRELTGRDLVRIADFLKITQNACRRIQEAEPTCPALAARIEALPECAELQSKIAQTFDSRGEIRENATPRLASLRAQIRSVRQQIYDDLGSIVEASREHLSEDTIPMRGGRLVVMLQAGARGRMPGLVHGRSSTGRSFYFEPLEAVDLNNQLQQAAEDEEAEKRRIVAEIIALLLREMPALEDHADLLADLDVLQASIRFGQRSAGRLAALAARHDLQLLQARHPLLDPELTDLREEALGQPGHRDPVVPLDLQLDADSRALVVTGPNAGGKTVALKTTGLLALAHQCGLPIPVAAGSKIPFLTSVVATIGDEQDLLADRSTFSGRLLRLREAWQAAAPDALILLDELGSGTDPEEGSALSVALLEALVERKSLTFVTTHLSQVAAAALELDGAVCAAMQFDARHGTPTYRLLPGPPGGSEALALARRLDLPGPWLDRAEALLGSEHRDLRKLLAEVDRSRRELAETQTRLDIELKDAEILRERLAKRESELIDERKSVGKALEKRLRDFQDSTKLKMRDEVEKIRRELVHERRAQKPERAAAESVRRLLEDAPELSPEPETSDVEVQVGGRVKHRSFGWTGTLEKIDRGRAHVQVGGKLFRCDSGDLLGLAPEKPAKKGSGGRGRRGDHSGGRGGVPEMARGRAAAKSASDLGEAPSELNLIGQRVEPALEALDGFLDAALLSGVKQTRIVHGHGSGKLRKAVRRHLRSHPAVQSQESGREREEDDGATYAHLRSS